VVFRIWRGSGRPPSRCQVKALPSRIEREKGQGTRFLCVAKAWASPTVATRVAGKRPDNQSENRDLEAVEDTDQRFRG